MLKEGKAYTYAKWCTTEPDRYVPIYVKRQAALWLDIAEGRNQEAYVDEEAYRKVCNLLKIMIHPDLRKPMADSIEDYAWLFIVAVMCTKVRDSDLDVRYYVTGVLETARKNFKTFVSAIIFILLMLIEPDFSRFFSVAPDLSLSSELKLAIRKIIKVSPALYDEDDPAFKIMRSQIRCLINDNEYTPLAYSQDNMDGKMANAFLADEAGALDEYPVEAMRSSQITLFNKLGIIISTQYPNDDNVMIDEIDIAKKAIDGLLEDQRVFALLYEPDEDLKVGETWQKDDRCIYQSNPVAVSHQYIFEEIKKKRAIAVLYENKRENYLCKHNNILYKGLGVEGYIDIQKVKLCRQEDNKAFWRGRRVWMGLDLSQTELVSGGVVQAEDLPRDYPYGREMLSLIGRALLTVALELAVAWLFKFRSGDMLFWIIVVNLVTQGLLNLGLNVFTYFCGALAGVTALFTLPVYVFLELVVTLAELAVYRRVLAFQEMPRGRITAYAWIVNACSCAVGVLLSFQLPGLF